MSSETVNRYFFYKSDIKKIYIYENYDNVNTLFITVVVSRLKRFYENNFYLVYVICYQYLSIESKQVSTFCMITNK